jgi:hypothetical protein
VVYRNVFDLADDFVCSRIDDVNIGASRVGLDDPDLSLRRRHEHADIDDWDYRFHGASLKGNSLVRSATQCKTRF